MTELSITTRIASGTPRATPVSALTSGSFSRTFDNISGEPTVATNTLEPRQHTAVDGKKLPVDDAVAEPADTASPTQKGSGSRRHLRSGENAPKLAAMPFIAAPADNTDSPEKRAGQDGTVPVGLTDDETETALIEAPVMAPPALILIDPLQPPAPSLPVARDSAAPALAATAAPVAENIAAIAKPVSPPIDTPTSPPAQPKGAPVADRRILLPVSVQLLDPGAPAPIPRAKLDPVEAPAPRIDVPTEAPRFTVAPAGARFADPQPVAVQPARQAFAAAFASLAKQAPMREHNDRELLSATIGVTTPVANTQLQAAVQQMNDTGQGALDLRQDRGLQGMIDHIETLRDDANARDTRIRLIPDALGTVDVAVRRDGSAVHVRFSSTSEATRIVLNDAQPRLVALAEARGLHIAGSSVDGGGGGNGPPPQQARPTAIRPASASSTDTDLESDIPTDTRIA